MYVVEDNSITGAFKTRVEFSPRDQQLIFTSIDGKLYTSFGADRKIKQLDKATAKRLETAIKQAYPEMADELL